ncbi:arsenical pump-driving ATPase [Salisediminibacterium beveridgei]|uniref:Arsenical pump-driving ATPase n=1 Tax=Salisediminibacterium beveridgei TaxID=632773 RepID=A0A1D7QY31_9BACI|nr:arsenical pump-driving ATPase [Salisediminibacterium beveridgei]AOM83909.1 Arsenical pump-driving ATPase [Salisediminibacterium beveridgei]
MKRLMPQDIVDTNYLFFTGKGGVGKTSAACATAMSLADQGKKVLIVSTDPASNLQDVFGTTLANEPAPVPGVDNLFAANLDPEEAAATYRKKMIDPYKGTLPQAALDSMEEQLSGACTVEIAAFDEFSSLLANEEATADFDHILFDTAPTGHTLRLLQLPNAWSDFLEGNENGASCLGPLAGLADKKALYQKTVEALANGERTKLILVARPDESTLIEAGKAAKELGDIGILNQMLVINGVFERTSEDDTAIQLEAKQHEALKAIPAYFDDKPTFTLPLVPYNLTGFQALRDLFDRDASQLVEDIPPVEPMNLPAISEMIDELSARNQGVFMTMGKGGVGKTTVAAAVATGLAGRGHKVLLTTTDPAAHVDMVMDHDALEGSLSVSRIDPKVEVENYKAQVLNNVSSELNEDELAYIKEDLESPCTEEIAVFRAFAETVDQAKDAFVVIDTAPTGHTLLLLDAAQSYHKEVERTQGDLPESVKQLLPRLRNPEETFISLVTLPEATPVYEAGRLQEDLRRAQIEPAWWIINQSYHETGTTDPVLAGRAYAERKWIKEVKESYANKTCIIPWQADQIKGLEKLKALTK